MPSSFVEGKGGEALACWLQRFDKVTGTTMEPLRSEVEARAVAKSGRELQYYPEEKLPVRRGANRAKTVSFSLSPSVPLGGRQT